MASSSSSAASSQSPKKYDVFISFRGEDTRSNFISHLHAALCRSKIETYIDYRLEKGDEVWPALVKAIRDSLLFLVVFSKNYASSTWCLRELTQILERSKDKGHLPVIPVFFKIDPSHIRKQTGSYEMAFAKHEKNSPKKQVHKWRAALTQAANLCGWDSRTYRNEVELIREIVKGVLIKLEPRYQSVYLDGFFGIHQQIAYIESLLCNESQDVRFIGIWGIGGIGKTAIATILFDKMCFAFESFCFLANVREETEKYGITYLKNKLLSILLENKEHHMGMPNGGSTYVTRVLSRKKVLLVLDDVNDLEQLKNLAGAHNWFGQGSRIIITTRDKQVFGKDVDNVYEVKALNFYKAFQLFSLNAFKNNCPDRKFRWLSWKVVNYVKGIPLALIVLGSFLYGKNEEEWESQLEKLKKMPCMKIQQTLKVSYDGLDPEEKDIFLSIACFFKGRSVEDVNKFLDACGYSTIIGLKSLQDKALITTFFGQVSMHDLIQEMGREIVRQESLKDLGKQSWLWDANDIYQVLKDNKGSEAIRGITLDMSKIEDLYLSPHVFAKMPTLKFLEFYDSKYERHNLHLPQGLESFSKQLRYLRWDNYPLKSLPMTFSAENLIKLEMQNSGMNRLWDGVQNLVNLKKIDFRDSIHLTEVPDFSKALHLEEVYLSNCTSLLEVHPSILSLAKLEVLELQHCVSLTSLKSDIHLKSLRRLCLYNCSRLKKFSVTSENMTYLDLRVTNINELPSSTGHQLKLDYLWLSGCKSLKNLPSNLFDGLRSLRTLSLNGCCNISELPDNIGQLSSLGSLEIQGSSVERLPASIKHLPSLKVFQLNECRRLRSLPELPSSVFLLHASDCSSLETIPLNVSVGWIEFRNCVKLDEHSVKATLANVLSNINRSVSEKENCNDHSGYYKAEIMYPGSRVPEWFKYRTTHASITIDLSSAPLSVDWGLIFCFVTPRSFLSNKSITIVRKGYLRIINDQRVEDVEFSHWIEAGNLTSDHVCLWQEESFCSKIHEILKKNTAVSIPKISLKMELLCRFDPFGGLYSPADHTWIKECGVCPTYASEYQSFIKEMKLGSQLSASGMGVGCSRFYEN